MRESQKILELIEAWLKRYKRFKKLCGSETSLKIAAVNLNIALAEQLKFGHARVFIASHKVEYLVSGRKFELPKGTHVVYTSTGQWRLTNQTLKEREQAGKMEFKENQMKLLKFTGQFRDDDQDFYDGN
jgi:hypothetical protein